MTVTPVGPGIARRARVRSAALLRSGEGTRIVRALLVEALVVVALLAYMGAH
jgi:hypothetical protein